MQTSEDEIPYVVVRHAIVVLGRTCRMVRRDWITDAVKFYPARVVGTARELRGPRPRCVLLGPAGGYRGLRFAFVGSRGGHRSWRIVFAFVWSNSIYLTVELPFGKLSGTRSRLYRSRFLQDLVNTSSTKYSLESYG